MKNLFIILFFFTLTNTVFSQDVVLQRIALLMPEGYSITGTAFLEELDNGDLQLRLSDDFDTPEGPDVRISLNNSISGTGGEEIVNLTAIDHFSGPLTVDVPSSINIDDYDFIVFFCVTFNALWASGEFGDSFDPSAFVCETSTVSSADGNNNQDICPSDGISDGMEFENSLGLFAGSEYVYLITDANEILQEVVFEDSYDFEGTDENEQRVYGLHYMGTLNEEIGSDRMETTASDCFEHSDNTDFITITKNACNVCESSEVNNASGSNTLDICPLDSSDDIVEFENSLGLTAGAEYAYLITDANEVLQEVVFDNSYNFEGSDLNEQRVYGVHYFGTLNAAIGSDRMATTASDCFEHSVASNYITITKNACPSCELSEVNTTSGSNTVDICPDDNLSDIITFEKGTDFNEQRVYGLHYDGTLNIVIGSDRSATTASGCYEHSDENTFITITKNACIVFECLSSETNTSQGNLIDICPTDGLDDHIALQNSLNLDAGANYAYLITDAAEIVQEVVLSDNFNFEGSDLNEQRVYGVHYDGVLNAVLGQNRFMTSASGCFEHSSASQFVTITKNACPPVFNCLPSAVTSGINTSLNICTSDGVSDIVNFNNSINASAGDHYAYLITNADNILLDVTFENSYDFENFSVSTIYVYGIHFDGSLEPQIGLNRLQTTATGCYEHSASDGFLFINGEDCVIPFMCQESSTSILGASNEIDICAEDGVDNVISFSNNLATDAGGNYAYLITDANEIVQFVVNTNNFNFEGSSMDEQRVYGMHYDGILNGLVGQNRSLTTATGCFTHSSAQNYITITKQACPPVYECMTTVTATTDWATSIDICPSDGIDDLVELRNNLSIETGDHYAYLLTDAAGILEAVIFDNSYNFEGTDQEEQRIYGINYDGALMPMMGVDRKLTTATGCFAHSGDDLYLTVSKNACSVEFECLETVTATTNWVTEIDICPNDGIDNRVELRNNLSIALGDHYAFLITDAAEVLQEVVFDTLYNFEGSSLDEQRVYGIHFDGTLMPMIGADRQLTTSSGCYTHSGDNLFLTVTKNACDIPFECEESLTATVDWVTEVDICANDNEDDLVELRNNIDTPPGDHYVYLLTDEFEVLQEVILDTVYNFENTGTAEQRIYGLSYAGDLLPQIGEDRKNTTASECFIHSGDSLFIRINKTAACISSTTDLNLAEHIMIYPNPSEGLININLENTTVEFKTISIYDFTGKLMNQVMIDDFNQQLNFEKPGVYMLRFDNSEVNTVKRVVIE